MRPLAGVGPGGASLGAADERPRWLGACSPERSPPQRGLSRPCATALRTLRWKERPLQCPRCQSHNVGPWGTYHVQPGLKRYRCKEQACKRTFNDLTGTLLDGSKRSLRHGILATFLLCLSCSSRRITREVGVHIRTGYRWCWWLRNAALSYELDRQFSRDGRS
jgi:transposase-like protein